MTACSLVLAENPLAEHLDPEFKATATASVGSINGYLSESLNSLKWGYIGEYCRGY